LIACLPEIHQKVALALVEQKSIGFEFSLIPFQKIRNPSLTTIPAIKLRNQNSTILTHPLVKLPFNNPRTSLHLMGMEEMCMNTTTMADTDVFTMILLLPLKKD
jgi:hypothetical protein